MTCPRVPLAELHASLAAGADYCDLIGTSENRYTPKARKRRSKKEQETNPYEFKIQAGVVKALRLMLPMDYIVQANIQEDSAGDQWCIVKGMIPGWPDLGVYGDGMCWLIEMKDAEGRLTAAQKKLHPRIIAAGIPLLPICRSLEQAVAFLTANGARFRARIAA